MPEHIDYNTKTEGGLRALNEAVARASKKLGYSRRVMIATRAQLGLPVRIYAHEDPQLRRQNAAERKRAAKQRQRQAKRSRKANR